MGRPTPDDPKDEGFLCGILKSRFHHKSYSSNRVLLFLKQIFLLFHVGNWICTHAHHLRSSYTGGCSQPHRILCWIRHQYIEPIFFVKFRFAIFQQRNGNFSNSLADFAENIADFCFLTILKNIFSICVKIRFFRSHLIWDTLHRLTT